MGSEKNDGTNFIPSLELEQKLCANGCGFSGTAANMNLCSKCYRELRLNEEQAEAVKAAMERSLTPTPKSAQEDAIKLNNNNKSVDAVMLEEQPRVGSSSSTALLGGSGEAEAKAANRCNSCKRKVGLLGFKCRCGSTFCGEHRYPEKHDCSFDFKNFERDALAKSNPVVMADKLQRRL